MEKQPSYLCRWCRTKLEAASTSWDIGALMGPTLLYCPNQMCDWHGVVTVVGIVSVPASTPAEETVKP